MKALGSLAADLVRLAIVRCDDPVERKERILLARETGLISDQEATDWIAIFEVKAA